MSARVTDSWSAPEYNKIASFVYSAENTAPVLALLDPKAGDKIIDFGCGSGQVTLELSKVVADVGIVVGVDSSQSMVGRYRSSDLSSSVVADRQGQGKRVGKRLRPRYPGARR
jgi:ubiquinone/menaquinone biosynthesis C-methylase UbiE